MGHIYFFASDRPSDNCSGITIFTKSVSRAYYYALLQFKKHNYKGNPIRLAL